MSSRGPHALLLALPLTVGLAAPLAPSAHAQEAAPPPAMPAPPPEPPPQAELPAPPETSPEARLDDAERRISELERSASGAPGGAPAASALKLSGYVQGRFQWHDDSGEGIDPERRTPKGTTRFLVRRARVKATYASRNSEYVLQIGSSNTEAVTLLDAEATLVDTWTPLGFRLTIGQFKIPFGFELLQSSAEREMPERIAILGDLFPGERDRGLRLQARYGRVRFMGALVNGNGLRHPLYTQFDDGTFKDLVGRTSVELGPASLGVSGYYGRHLEPVLPPADMPDQALRYDSFGRIRAGADGQVTLPTPLLGPGIIRAEFVWSRDRHRAREGVPSDRCRDLTRSSLAVTGVQRLGQYGAAFARVDHYDPRRTLPSQCEMEMMQARSQSRNDDVLSYGGGLLFDALDNLRLTLAYLHPREKKLTSRRNDDVLSYGGGLLFDALDNLRLTLAYLHPREKKLTSRRNDVFTLQLQARF